MNDTIKRRLRCAVYTRKSTEEGLDQEYNSIDAQRDSGAAYIASRKAEGWIPVGDDYDDPAFSGGTLERPALQRLLTDIAAGQVDIVVVYKIDRLTRALSDFSRIVEVFDRHGVSFVSVTQQFNTTDSMGRLMLNILLSFAQFEREVTADRIRDKMVASKKKGMWMHGIPPLGYDIKDRRLAINPHEAEVVRLIFRRYLEIGSSIRLVQELAVRGVTGKGWTSQSGRVLKRKPIDKSQVYKMLANRTYLGELRHRDTWFTDAHPPIIDRDTWEQVQGVLVKNPRTRANENRARVDYLLKGLVFGSDGRALTPWHTTKKNGRRYRYYLSTRDMHEGAGASGLPRLPAAELESMVVNQLRRVLRAPAMINAMVPAAVGLDPTLDAAQVNVAMTQLDRIWDELFPAEQQRIVRLLVERIIVTTERIDVRLRPAGIDELAAELTAPEQAAA